MNKLSIRFLVLAIASLAAGSAFGPGCGPGSPIEPDNGGGAAIAPAVTALPG